MGPGDGDGAPSSTTSTRSAENSDRVAAGVGTSESSGVGIAPTVWGRGRAVAIAGMATEFARGLAHGNLGDVLTRLTSGVAGDGAAHVGPTTAVGVVRRVLQSGASLLGGAAALMTQTFTTVSRAIAQLFLLAVCAYYFSAEGPRMLVAVERASPLAPAHLQRLREEFMAVARAMLVGELLTALVQGVVAGVIYFALGIPNALVLSLLTSVVALIPTVGSSLVWVPIAIGLGLSGRTRDAVILAAFGVVVIGTVDNLLRPYFARLGAGKMHPMLLFLGIFGGLEAFGAWGILLGPLALALFVAAFRLYADEVSRRRAGAG